MTLLQHLAELRHRLIVCAGAIGLGGLVGYFTYNPVLTLLRHPYCHIVKVDPHATLGGSCRFFVQDPLEQLTIRLQVAFFTGLLIALPVVLWQIWRFVTPGLKPNEKKYAVPFIIASCVFFALGGTVAWLTLPLALRFFHAVGGGQLATIYSAQKYLRLVTLMILAYGIAFEFPVLLVALQLVRVLSSARLRKWRRGAIIGVTVFSAVFTPSSDPISMFAMAIPMYLFYEGAIVTGRLLKR